MTLAVSPEAICEACGKTFQRFTSFQRVCRTPRCANRIVKIDKRKEAEKTRTRRVALLSISQLEGRCRKIIQKIARIRDRNDGCISCHMGPNYGGQWHGSHYRAHGACSSLQMHLWNVHKSCAQCNLYKGGNKEGYIAGLLKKPGYGPERLEWLDAQPKSMRFSRDYLMRFEVVMGKRMRRMEKQHA